MLPQCPIETGACSLLPHSPLWVEVPGQSTSSSMLQGCNTLWDLDGCSVSRAVKSGWDAQPTGENGDVRWVRCDSQGTPYQHSCRFPVFHFSTEKNQKCSQKEGNFCWKIQLSVGKYNFCQKKLQSRSPYWFALVSGNCTAHSGTTWQRKKPCPLFYTHLPKVDTAVAPASTPKTQNPCRAARWMLTYDGCGANLSQGFLKD